MKVVALLAVALLGLAPCGAQPPKATSGPQGSKKRRAIEPTSTDLQGPKKRRPPTSTSSSSGSSDKMEEELFGEPSTPQFAGSKKRSFGAKKLGMNSWKVFSPPNDPWASGWVLGLFVNTRGFWLNGLRRKSILENDTNTTNPGNWTASQKSSFFCKIASFLMHFLGPHGAHRTATN